MLTRPRLLSRSAHSFLARPSCTRSFNTTPATPTTRLARHRVPPPSHSAKLAVRMVKPLSNKQANEAHLAKIARDFRTSVSCFLRA